MNVGSIILNLLRVESSCFCTLVERGAEHIEPSDATEFIVTLDPHLYPKEEVDTYIIIESDDSLRPRQYIAVRAKIQPEFILEPAEIDFGDLRVGESVTSTVYVRQTGAQVLEEPTVRASDTMEIVVKDVSCALGNGMGNQNAPRVYSLDVVFSPTASASYLRNEIEILTNFNRVPRVTLPYYAKVRGLTYSLSRSVVLFGEKRPGESLGAFELTCPEDTLLKSVHIDESEVALHESQVESEGVTTYRIEIFAKPSAAIGEKSGKVHLTLTDNALVEHTEVSYYGLLRRAGD
ncbi:MAG: hypothetical protein AMXMBFR82_07210 [Candidatus Hydrogenedentota bacterium]